MQAAHRAVKLDSADHGLVLRCGELLLRPFGSGQQLLVHSLQRIQMLGIARAA